MECSLCGKNEAVVDHHFPIMKKDGGKLTIEICAQCHWMIHNSTIIVNCMDCNNEKEIKLKEIKIINKFSKEEFPKFSGIISPAQIITLNPPWKWRLKNERTKKKI